MDLPKGWWFLFSYWRCCQWCSCSFNVFLLAVSCYDLKRTIIRFYWGLRLSFGLDRSGCSACVITQCNLGNALTMTARRYLVAGMFWDWSGFLCQDRRCPSYLSWKLYVRGFRYYFVVFWRIYQENHWLVGQNYWDYYVFVRLE